MKPTQRNSQDELARLRFDCSLCGENFPRGQSTRAAVEELARNYPHYAGPLADCDLVCTRCYRSLMPRDAVLGSTRIMDRDHLVGPGPRSVRPSV